MLRFDLCNPVFLAQHAKGVYEDKRSDEVGLSFSFRFPFKSYKAPIPPPKFWGKSSKLHG